MKLVKPVFSGLLLLYALCGVIRPAQGYETLKLLFEIRHPLSYRDVDGQLGGILITPIAQAMVKAGIPFTWVEKNDEALCAVGMFKNKERQKFAKFSAAVLRDISRPSVMLAHRDFKPDKSMNLLEALSIPGTKMLKKESASYGSVIDEVIERSRVGVISTTAESFNMGKMIAAHRADFIFVPEDEALTMIKTIPDGDKLHIFKPQNMPQGPERYLMCSQAVSDELIQKFNRAIAK